MQSFREKEMSVEGKERVGQQPFAFRYSQRPSCSSVSCRELTVSLRCSQYEEGITNQLTEHLLCAVLHM